MQLAADQDVRSTTFPSISTGVYGYPMVEAAGIAVGTVAAELRAPGCLIERTAFVLFGAEAFEVHVRAAERLLG